MGVVWSREAIADRDLELAKDNGGSATRSFLVRTDSPSTSLSTISAHPGVVIGDLHPDDGNLACETIAVKASDDSGLLYTVTVSYSAAAKEGSDSDGGQDAPGAMDGLTPQWGGSSSVTSEPIYEDINGAIMCNSAGDPLEGLEAERAQFHLTYTMYYPTHAGANGWLAHSTLYTNAINDDQWNGGESETWKCQGCGAKLNIDRQGPGGSARVYWEVTWDFAYRADRWRLEPWDIGFNELVDENGDPAPTYGISTGDGGSGGSGDDGPCEGNLRRRAIKGADGKPVRQPVALQDGVAKPACFRPDALLFNIYSRTPFKPTFGEVFTPQP